MPLIPVADDPGIRGVLGREPAPEPQGDVIAAAFRQENIVVSALQALRNSGQFAPAPGYSALPDIEGTPYFANHSDRFTGSQSPGETQAIKMQIDQEEADRRTVAAAGVPGVIASMVAGGFDPTIAFPAGIAVRAGKEGLRFGRAALRTGTAGALQVGVQESILQATQQTRTWEETALNVGSATLLSALLGGAAARFLEPAEHGRLVDAIDRERRAMDVHAAGAPAPTRDGTGVYTIDNAIDRDGPVNVRVVRGGKDGEHWTIDSGDNLIDISRLIQAGKSPEEAIAIEMGDHPMGAAPNVAAVRPVEAAPAGAAATGAAGAAATDTRRLELVRSGLERVPLLQADPMSVLLTSPSVSARRAAVDLAETPLRFEQNVPTEGTVVEGVRMGARDAVPTTAGPSLERLARLQINQTRVAVSDRLGEFWRDLRFAGEAAPWFARARDAVGMLQRPEGLPTFEQFKELVSDALMSGDRHAIPQVQEAAQFIRAQVFEPWKERAIAAKLLPEGVDVKTAESYFQRVYNKQKIAAQRPEFVNTVLSWLKADQANKAAAQERIGALHDALQAVSNQADRLQAKVDRLAASAENVEARLSERAMEVGRTERRTGALEERASSIAEEASEIEAFVAEMRRQVSDPAMRDRLDAMERDARELRRADRPMTEAQLRAIEDEELKGVLTGTTRMAAEMVVGRRKMPRAPSFISWLVANGGINDVGGDVRHVAGGNRMRPGLISREGRSLDEIGEKLSNEFPEAFPAREETGHGRPSHSQILEWIDSAMRGHEPDWWAQRFSSARQDEVAAGNLAAALDEALTRAGVEVRSVRDVAKILRDERTGGVSLADLDRIAAEMEAVGQDIPVSMRRAAADEEVAATRQGIADLRALIARGRAGAEAKGRRLRLAEARGEEAGLAEKANRGRLGVLEDRLSRAEQRRELLEDAQLRAEEAHAALRERIEAEIAAWEGKSAAEAKSALRARDTAAEAAAGRPEGRGGGRLTSADAAVDRAVRRILESDRDISDAELRGRAHEITERVLGSPDGRLPYDMPMGGPQTGRPGASDARGPLHSREFNIPDSVIAPWLERDVEHVVGQHLRTMVTDVLITERFGDVNMTEAFRRIEDDFARLIDATKSEAERTALGKQREVALDRLAGVRDRIRGTFGFSTWQTMRNAARTAAAVKNFNVLTSMGMVTISSLPDLAGPVFRWGLGSVFADAWRPLLASLMGDVEARAATKEAFRQFRAMGIVLESFSAERQHALNDIMDGYKPQSRLERTLQWGADKFQFANLLAPWTDMGKTVASLVASSEILRAADMVVAGTATRKQLAALAENGIDRAMAERIARAFAGGGETRAGVRLPNTADWADRGARDAFEGAVGREADIAIITPGQEKPLWMSDPLLSVLGQFKAFMASATQRILIANLQRHDAQVLQGVLFSMGLGMVSYKVNSLLGGQPTSDRPQDWVKEAISRGGLLGWIEEGNALASKMTRGGVDMYRLIGSDKPLSRYAGRSVLDQMLGPTAGKVESLAQVTGAAASRDWTESDTKALRRLTAFQNLFYLRGLFNQVEAGANSAFGVPMKGQ